ncbi:unnamed protein product, partial [Polarella glacialis]
PVKVAATEEDGEFQEVVGPGGGTTNLPASVDLPHAILVSAQLGKISGQGAMIWRKRLWAASASAIHRWARTEVGACGSIHDFGPRHLAFIGRC